MNLLVWLALGLVAGCSLNLFLRVDGRRGLFLDLVVGVAGAVGTGYLLGPAFGVGPLDGQEPGLAAVALGALGAIGVLLVYAGRLRDVLLRPAAWTNPPGPR